MRWALILAAAGILLVGVIFGIGPLGRRGSSSARNGQSQVAGPQATALANTVTQVQQRGAAAVLPTAIPGVGAGQSTGSGSIAFPTPPPAAPNPLADETWTYLTALRGAGLDSLVQQVNTSGDDITVSVNGTWRNQPPALQQQLAQNLWRLWAQLHSPSNPDRARITLIDAEGKRLGGSNQQVGSQVSLG